MGLMTAGGLIMACSQAWGWQIAGRLLSGAGAVLMNVLMSKMVSDWFAGRELATAMAIFVNSWPFGLAVALVALPAVAGTGGLARTYLLAAGLPFAGLLALARMYRAPPSPMPAAAPTGETGASSGWPRGRALAAVVVAGLVWGLYNAGLGMVFGYGPSLLAERGWSVAAAGRATSVLLWLVLISVPLGGLLADRSGRPKAVIVIGVVAFGLLLLLAGRTEAVLLGFAVAGLLGGVAAGPIMTLPAAVLSPTTRAIGMGVFFTLFYLVVVVMPWVAGEIATLAGTARVTFDIGSAMQAACLPLLWLYQRLARRPDA